VKIAVVGGGVGGLTCGLRLRERGHEVVVLEREAEPGGKVQTERTPSGWLVERGPAGVLDNSPPTLALYRDLGIENELVVSDDAARRRFIVRDGRMMLVSPPNLLVGRLMTMRERLRVAAEPLVRARRVGEGDDDDETLEAFTTRRLGASVASRFVEPIASGVYAGDWSRLSAASAFPKLVELERAHGSLLAGAIATARQARREGKPRKPARLTSLRGGMGLLSRTLAARLGPSLRTGGEALALRARGGGGFTIDTNSGPLDVDRVVLALPSEPAAKLVAGVAGGVGAALADAYRGIPYAPIAAICLGFPRASVRHPLDGFGFLAPRREGERVLGVLWMTSIFPGQDHQAPEGHVLLRVMLGGRTDPEGPGLPDAVLVAIARQAALRHLGAGGEPSFTHVTRWTHAIAQYELGHGRRVEEITARGEPAGIYATGAALRGVGVNDVIRDAEAVAARLV
jgi:oxygen-dependent protoporphyrinogen oxidase